MLLYAIFDLFTIVITRVFSFRLFSKSDTWVWWVLWIRFEKYRVRCILLGANSIRLVLILCMFVFLFSIACRLSSFVHGYSHIHDPVSPFNISMAILVPQILLPWFFLCNFVACTVDLRADSGELGIPHCGIGSASRYSKGIRIFLQRLQRS